MERKRKESERERERQRDRDRDRKRKRPGNYVKNEDQGQLPMQRVEEGGEGNGEDPGSQQGAVENRQFFGEAREGVGEGEGEGAVVGGPYQQFCNSTRGGWNLDRKYM